MAELRPYPLAGLIRRMFRELEEKGSIFDLPQKKFFGGSSERDYRVEFHNRGASSPLGPAAGPHTQMAQNIVLSWLGGCRIMELKTVQIIDTLEIPRPCIDMATVGYNVEWSQELRLHESLDEYVKASMLIDILVASGKIDLPEGSTSVVYDMSVGYDLKGIQSEPVQTFMRGMLDASEYVERFKAEIPDEFARFRDIDFTTQLSDTLTLSTFHGCPPDEIEQIINWLLDAHGIHCIVKLNPTLLGPERARDLMGPILGYEEVTIPDSAFENDTHWDQAVGFIERLWTKAQGLGLGFGVKFSNTLLVKNHKDFFPEEKEMYLSGTPLHVLAMNLVRRVRHRFGPELPISFAGGIDSINFPDAVALGLVPITTCSDLLETGGYARLQKYYKQLDKRMAKAGATHIADYIVRAYGNGEAALADLDDLDDATRATCTSLFSDGADLRAGLGDHAEVYRRWVRAAMVRNTDHYVAGLETDPRYSKAKNNKPPRKVGSHLALFDCLTCDKCIPVCPNHANFGFPMPKMDEPVLAATKTDDAWAIAETGRFEIKEKHQIGNFADFCNECGNCDIFCPEFDGPYIMKPRFFGSLADWKELADHDGFWLQKSSIHGRFSGAEFELHFDKSGTRYVGKDFDVRITDGDGDVTVEDNGETTAATVDLGYFQIMRYLHRNVLAEGSLNYLTLLV